MIKEFYTYLHRDANGQVFYVGCSTTLPNKRGVRAKLQRAYASCGHSKEWEAVAKLGYTVEILSKFSDRNDAFDAEKKLIEMYREQGAPLVNVCSGGPGMPGVKDSLEVRVKKSITKLGVLNPMHGVTGAKHHNSRKVRDSVTGAMYDSVLIAAETQGHKMKTLCNWLSGHRPNPTSLEFA